MSKTFMAFDNSEIQKRRFHYSKHPVDIYTVNIDKIMISNEVSFDLEGLESFVIYKEGEKVKPLCTMLPKIRGYAKNFD